MKKILLFVMLVSASILHSQDLIITGVIDGSLPGGEPKAVELYATADIADLSLYGIGSANNGDGTNGAEFTGFSGSLTSGDFIYVATEATNFNSWFGFMPDYEPTSAVNVNGDDAIELFFDATGSFAGSETVIDVFGDINTDGTGEAWEYMDGWAYRNNVTGPDGSAFTLGNWSFSGTNALDGESTNAGASTPFPTGSYSTVIGDFTAPLWSSGFPFLDNLASTSFDIFGQIDELGTIFYVVILNEGTAPSSAEVVAGTAPDGALFSGSVSVVSALSTVSTSVTGLISGVEYDVYIVAQDDEGTPNLQSSPVKLNFPEPIAITEFMNNPSGSESTDEWVELFNYGQDAVNLTGWTISDEGSDTDAIGPITINAGSYLILAKSKTDFETIWLSGTPNANVVELSGLTLANGADEIILSDPNGNVIWSIAYTDAGTNGQAAYLDYDEDSSIRVYTAIVRSGLDGTGTLGYEDSGDASAVTASGDTGSPLNGVYTQTLPVVLSSFNGKGKDKSSVLSWSTITETNNSGFQIEKSLDGVEFQPIGFVEGNGNTNELIEYSFVDHSFMQTSYYRLNQIDFDGKNERSSTIMIVNNNETEFVIYPNPFSNELNIDFSSASFQMIVYNMSGKKVIEEEVTTDKATLLLEGLLIGTYQVHTYNKHFNSSQKLVKR